MTWGMTWGGQDDIELNLDALALLLIALYLFIESFCVYSIQFCQIPIQHYTMTSDGINFRADCLAV